MEKIRLMFSGVSGGPLDTTIVHITRPISQRGRGNDSCGCNPSLRGNVVPGAAPLFKMGKKQDYPRGRGFFSGRLSINLIIKTKKRNRTVRGQQGSSTTTNVMGRKKGSKISFRRVPFCLSTKSTPRRRLAVSPEEAP